MLDSVQKILEKVQYSANQKCSLIRSVCSEIITDVDLVILHIVHNKSPKRYTDARFDIFYIIIQI